MQPTPNVLGAPANGLLGRWGGSKYNQLNPTALSGMTAWYDANERNTLFVDASGRTSVVSNRAEDGGERFLYLNGASGTYASTPDSNALDITQGDFRIRLAAEDWTPSAVQALFQKSNGIGAVSYFVNLTTTGAIQFGYSPTGLASDARNGTSTAVVSFTDRQIGWVRVTYSSATGTVQFFTAADQAGVPSSWTQLGTDVSLTAGTFGNSSLALAIGATTIGGAPFSGRIYRAIVLDAPSGNTVFDANFSTHTTGSAPLTESANGAVVSFLGNARVTYVGPTNCLALNGVSGNYAEVANNSNYNVTGDIEIRALAMLPNWAAPAQYFVFAGKFQSAQRSYQFGVGTTGRLEFQGSPNGTSTYAATATVSLSLPAFSKSWVRVKRTAATGDVVFETSPDAITWTQVGATVSTAAGNIFAGTSAISIGRNNDNTVFGIGNLYRVQVFNGFSGTDLRFDPNFTTAPKLANSFTESSGNNGIVTITSTGDLGARIAGEKDLVQLTLTKQPIYLPWSGTNYGWLRGASGDFFSTPDSASVSVTGPIDLRADAQLNDWSAASIQYFVSKVITDGQSAYDFAINTAGNLVFRYSPTGTFAALRSAASTVAVAFADFARGQVRVTYDSATGTVQFFTRTDGDVAANTGWTQLGADVALTAGTIFDGTDQLRIGQSVSVGNPTGRIFRAQVLNGINGTVVADFNPTLYTSGTTVLDGSVSTQSLVLDGSSGAYASTPDSAALSVTGDIDVRWYGAMDDWTPSAVQALIAKDNVATQRSYYFRLNSNGNLIFGWSSTGATGGIITAESTAAPSTVFTDRSPGWVRATLDVDNGAGGKTVTFFTSTNGTTWTQLGSAVTTAGTTSIFAGTAILEVGSVGTGTLERMSGRVFRAQVLNGINGTIAFDANFAVTPSLTATSFTESSSNAATVTLNGTATIGPKWTLNGGSTIVNRTSLYFDGSDDYMKAPAFALSQPETVYFVGQRVSWTGTDRIFDGNSTDTMSMQQAGSTPAMRISSDGYANQIINSGDTIATRNIIAAVYNGASSAFRINRGSASTGNAGSGNGNGFAIGSNAAGSQASNISANEVAIYAAAQDTSTQNRWALYAGKKWGFNA